MEIHRSTVAASPDGKPLDEIILDAGPDGLSAHIFEYGAILTSLWVPDRDGNRADVVLGYSRPEEYLAGNPHYFGAVCGRCANRIAGGCFQIGKTHYQLAVNDPPNHLHGGLRGFDKVIWRVVNTKQTDEELSVELVYHSADGEEGYPGDLEVHATYVVTRSRELVLRLRATCQSTSIVNLTHHAYWNLSGSESIETHLLALRAEAYTPIDSRSIPTGEIRAVSDTPFDFRDPTALTRPIEQLGGLDHNFVLDPKRGDRPAATLFDPVSGRRLQLTTTQPGLQVYTANALDGIQGKRAVPYRPYAGVCLEPQHYPDSINHPHFPSVLLRPDELYEHQTRFVFDAVRRR